MSPSVQNPSFVGKWVVHSLPMDKITSGGRVRMLGKNPSFSLFSICFTSHFL